MVSMGTKRFANSGGYVMQVKLFLFDSSIKISRINIVPAFTAIHIAMYKIHVELMLGTLVMFVHVGPIAANMNAFEAAV